MSLDELARRAGADLRASVAHDLDVDAALAALEGTWRRRRQVRLIAAGVTLAAAAATLLTVLPASAPRASAPPPTSTRSSPCLGNEHVTCPSPDQVQVRAAVPYDVHLPTVFVGEPGSSRSSAWVEFFQRTPGMHQSEAGVTVMTGVEPARSGKHLVARELAYWVAGRPFLVPTTAHRTSLDGFPAWRVEATLRPGEPRSQRSWCESIQFVCRALLQPDVGRTEWETGPRRGETGYYLFVDVPGPHTVAIRSWAAEGNDAAFSGNDELIDGLTFYPSP
jgi:hypothetical protein